MQEKKRKAEEERRKEQKRADLAAMRQKHSASASAPATSGTATVSSSNPSADLPGLHTLNSLLYWWIEHVTTYGSEASIRRMVVLLEPSKRAGVSLPRVSASL